MCLGRARGIFVLILHFLRVEVPKNWAVFCDSVTDNFRVINPADFSGSQGVGYT
jgi:hypothetical protein